jgi:hypothetical protein
LVFEGRAWAFRKTVQTKTVIIGFLRFWQNWSRNDIK